MLIYRIKLIIWRRKWRKQNKHNETTLVNLFDMDCVSVGRHTYGGINALTYNKESKLRIGNFCSIAENVKFIVSADHYVNTMSTFPFKVKFMHEDWEGVSKGDIIVDDDVWIGYGVTVLSGIHIGQGAVLATGAVVTKDVPPYSIVAGVPAKVIKYRFDEKYIAEMLRVDFGSLTGDMIRTHIDELYRPISEMDHIPEWLPIR